MKKTDRQKLIRAKLKHRRELKELETARFAAFEENKKLHSQLSSLQRTLDQAYADMDKLRAYQFRTRRILGDVQAVQRPDQQDDFEVRLRLDRDAWALSTRYRDHVGDVISHLFNRADHKAFDAVVPNLLPINVPVSQLAMLLAICVKEMDHAHAMGVQAEYCLAAALNLFFIVMRKFADDHSPDKWPTIVRAVHEMMRQEMSDPTRTWSMMPFMREVGQLMSILDTHECRKVLTLKNPFYVKH